MSTKYHLSPSSGRPNKCTAKTSCPFGGADDHYSSKQEAKDAYEAQMSALTFNSEPAAYSSPFGAREAVRAKTAWAYDDIVAAHGGYRFLKAAHPTLEFRKSPKGELVVTGTAKKVEAYIQEPGGEPGDIALSLSRLKSLDNKGKKAEPLTSMVHAQPPAGATDEHLYEDFQAIGGWEAVLAEEEPEGSSLTDETEVDPDDDWVSIKCEDCSAPLSNCTCHICSECLAHEDEEHEDYCSKHVAKPRAYSWD